MEKTGSRSRLLNSKRFLATQRVARLATVSANGKPHIVPVVYTYDGKHVYIVLDEKRKRVAPLRLKRARNIAANPYVSVLVDRYSEDWRKLVWVRVDGVARILQRGKAHDRAVALLRAKYPQYRKMKLEARPVIEIAVRRVVGWANREDLKRIPHTGHRARQDSCHVSKTPFFRTAVGNQSRTVDRQ